jgi:hypothetical protein
MANSKLLKEAIADAKAVKETALANAKLALEEAFTPRLQSILSQKLRAEAEMEDDAEQVDEELKSDGIGSKVDAGYAETPGPTPSYDAITDLSVGVKKDSGKPEQAGTDYKKVADINEEDDFDFGGEEEETDNSAEIAELRARLAELEGDGIESDESGEDEEDDFDFGGEEEGEDYDVTGSEEEETEDDMDLESIIRELEAQLGDDDSTEEEPAMGEEYGEEDMSASGDEEEVEDDTIDLEEILREMESDMTDDSEEVNNDDMAAELNEAYTTIKSLQSTINEVNLLNAKLLFANKLFRAHNMTNEQKVKVIETLDRTKTVREVKLVYSTLAENFKYTTTSNKVAKKSISEGIASKVTKSTKPSVSKQVIVENTQLSDRFKKLAGILK